MELTSDAFEAGQAIPTRHACEGSDVSPPLRWSEPPEGTSSFALVCDDPDAPGGTFTHWIAWGIGPDRRALGEGDTVAREGRNDFGQTGYRGPCPPRGDEPHRYSFRLYALDSEPELRPGAGKSDLERALDGRVLATAELVGTYERA